MERFATYLADIAKLTQESQSDKKVYVHPALKNLGCISIVLVREAIAPVIFRNAEAEITDIEISDDVYIRAVPNKFKYSEKGRGLQILRVLGVGGRMPQNKTALGRGKKPSEAFDLNTLVFGDSINEYYDTGGKKKMLPVKAAVNYSDGLSLLPKALCVDETFHIRAAEDGTLFDAEDKKNTDNLFSRYFVKPGTLMVQVLSTRGRVLPLIGLKHLLLCVGLAGSYGGQTSLTGTNIRTRLVGIYGGKFEQAISSPYELVKKLRGAGEEVLHNPETTISALHKLLIPAYEMLIGPEEAQNQVEALVSAFNEDGLLAAEYRTAAPKVADLFDQWFGKDDAKKEETGKKAKRGKADENAEGGDLLTGTE
ncbi:MAG TPA: type I-D CRISPR-associated protein Csc2 [Candidatus Contendobacter sp.]|nr:type I-D CRISPR-associated protein Csc2 [Candidatus Contendobacter sp.]HRD49747.1 type I-D CRISPR-associated protein Csc2 [Candidatus Contendobacter sp.]